MSSGELGTADALSSPMFIGAAVLTAILMMDAVGKLRQLRFVFAGLVYLTVALWYLVDPVYQPDEYRKFSGAEFDNAYLQVILFLLAFRGAISYFAPKTLTRVLRDFDPRQVDRGPVVGALLCAWLALFVVGIAWADFDVLGVMFPLKARVSWNAMFARGRYGGATGFLLSSAAYSYMVVCSGFGVVFVCSRRPVIRGGMLAMMAFTWPMFLLDGSRHKILAVVLPAILATLLLKRWSLMQRAVFLVVCGAVLNLVMLAVLEFRNDGLDRILTDSGSMERIAEARHLGLNMSEEMMHILRYQRQGSLPIEWGMNYIEHALNVVPRGLWPDKPMPGRQFAFLRVGIASNNDVAATVSYGMIGQGVANFGPYIGPLVPALLLALMGRFLCRLRNEGDPFVRASLILLCLGLIPNLGRDISLMVLWPAVFGYFAVRLYERRFASSGRRGERRHSSSEIAVRPHAMSSAAGSLSAGPRLLR